MSPARTRNANVEMERGLDDAATQEERSVGARVADALTQRGYLMTLNVSRWSGQTRLLESDLGLEGLTDANLHKLGRRQLVPPTAVQRITALETKARQRIAQVSYPFPIGSSRFVPTGVLGVLLADLARIRDEFTVEVRAFAFNYETLADETRREWMANAKKIQEAHRLDAAWLTEFEGRLNSSYPTREQVEKSFTMAWSLFQFALPKGLRAQLVSGEEALRAATLAAEARKQVEEQVAGFVGEAATELRRRAGELCSHIARQVRERGEKLSERSLEPLRELIGQFRALDFTADGSESGIAAELEKFQKEVLGGEAVAKQARESADYRASLATSLETLAERATGESERAAAEALDRFMQYGREGRRVTL